VQRNSPVRLASFLLIQITEHHQRCSSTHLNAIAKLALFTSTDEIAVQVRGESDIRGTPCPNHFTQLNARARSNHTLPSLLRSLHHNSQITSVLHPYRRSCSTNVASLRNQTPPSCRCRLLRRPPNPEYQSNQDHLAWNSGSILS